MLGAVQPFAVTLIEDERPVDGSDHAATLGELRAHKVFLMNPGNFELIGWVEVLGMPVLPDESVGHKRVKLVCGVGRAGILDQQPVFWAPDGLRG